MRESVKLPPHLLASDRETPEPMRCGQYGETFRALRAWSKAHPNPLAPRPRAAREKLFAIPKHK
jgi:hypothetical protein